jgi:hypothetical protein
MEKLLPESLAVAAFPSSAIATTLVPAPGEVEKVPVIFF